MGIYAVTGAASGIGKAIVEQLESEGHSVITVDIANAQINADLADEQACQDAINAIIAAAPDGLDGFIPCAGLGPETKDITLVALVNYFAAVAMVEGLMPSLQSRGGAVVLISSNSSRMMEYEADYMDALLSGDRARGVEAVKKVNGQVAYGAGKQALTRWMRRNNEAAANAGVRMNAIAPGFTVTGMTESGMQSEEYGDAIRAFVDSIPIGRPGQAQDQADAVSFLLGDKASFISGSVLYVDGGHDAVFRPDQY